MYDTLASKKKLVKKKINTPFDFKITWTFFNLKQILGIGMSEKMWEVTIKHARTCIMGNKIYMSRGPNYTLLLNPVCQVIKAVINEQTYPTTGITTMNKVCVSFNRCTHFLNYFLRETNYSTRF